MISLRKGCSALLAAAVLLTGACDSEEVTTAPLDPATLSVVGSNAVEAPANLPVANLLRFRLTTKNNTPVSGRVVKFTVTGTGATLSSDSSFTDENGEVAVGLTVGAPGTYTVTATSAGVPPVTITATSVAPAPAYLLAGPGNNQAGLANEALQPITAVVLNSDGTPAAGVPVTFTVTAGGGSVSPTTVTTNANGLASTTFTIGTTGTQQVTATSAGLSAAVFTATVADPCIASRAIGVPATLNRSLEVGDCKRADNRFIEYFTPATSTFQVTQTSSAFTPNLVLTGATLSDTLAVHNPAAASVFPASASFKVLAPAGTYKIGATTQAANQTGAYTLTTVAASATTDITNCEARVFVVSGLVYDGSIVATDCVFTGDATQRSDRFRIFMKAGQTMRVRLVSRPQAAGNIDLWIRVINPAGTTVVTDIDCCGSSTQEDGTFTATTTGSYFIEVGVYYDPSAPTPQLGNYRLTIGG
jgi:hypothetical protein